MKFYLAVFLLYINFKKKESIIKNNNVTIYKHPLDSPVLWGPPLGPGPLFENSSLCLCRHLSHLEEADINNYTLTMSFCNVNKGFAGLDTNKLIIRCSFIWALLTCCLFGFIYAQSSEGFIENEKQHLLAHMLNHFEWSVRWENPVNPASTKRDGLWTSTWNHFAISLVLSQRRECVHWTSLGGLLSVN